MHDRYVTLLCHTPIPMLLVASCLQFNISYAETLEETINLTLKGNPDFVATKASRKVRDSELLGSYSGYLPSVDLTTSIARDRNKNASTQSTTLTKRESSFTVSQMIFDGFSVKSDIESKAATVKNSAHNVQSNHQDTILEVIKAYLEVLRLEETLIYSKENLTSHQEIYESIRLRVESGVGKKADLDQATGRLAQARTNQINEHANLRNAYATFVRVTGRLPKELIRPTPPEDELPASDDAAVAIALKFHPNILRDSAAVYASRADKNKAKASYFPSLSLSVSGKKTTNDSGNRSTSENMNAALNFSYNVFRGGADYAAEMSAAWSLEEAKETLKVTKRVIEQTMLNSWNDYTSAKSILKYNKQHREAADRARNAYKNQFALGQRTLLDLLNSENELYSTKKSYLDSQYKELLGRYQILHSMGKLREYFKISLPEEAQYKISSWIEGF